MAKQHYLTEWRSSTTAAQVNIHMYQMPLTDKEKRFTMLSSTRYQLMQSNQYIPIVYHDLYIASFEPIMNWDHVEVTYANYEKRPINLENPSEIILLEKLIKADIFARNRQKYVEDRGVLRSRKPHRVIENNILIFQGIHLDVNITTTGDIYIGFERKHRFEFKETLADVLTYHEHGLKKGDKVVDFTNKRTYEYTFEEVANYTASDISPLLHQSIFDYYKHKNQSWKIKDIPPRSLVIHVKNDDGQIFPYLACFLKKTCHLQSIPHRLRQKVNKVIKLAPKDRIQSLLSEVYNFLQAYP